jgi:hypothetical protein
MTEQLKAEAYVRKQRILIRQERQGLTKLFKTILLPINLQDWLAVLGEETQSIGVQRINNIMEYCYGHKNINFNLTTGQPANEESYKAFNEIVK